MLLQHQFNLIFWHLQAQFPHSDVHVFSGDFTRLIRIKLLENGQKLRIVEDDFTGGTKKLSEIDVAVALAVDLFEYLLDFVRRHFDLLVVEEGLELILRDEATPILIDLLEGLRQPLELALHRTHFYEHVERFALQNGYAFEALEPFDYLHADGGERGQRRFEKGVLEGGDAGESDFRVDYE